MARQIDGHRIGGFKLVVKDARPMRQRTGWLQVTVVVEGPDGKTSKGPLMTGILSGGGRGVRPWVECRVFPQVSADTDSLIDARKLGLERGVINHLGGLIPPGGHLMIDYESAGQELTLAELVLQVPPPASYLGELMFRAGCRGEFKDWYFSEGGHEGPRKLQANKSPDKVSARAAFRQHLENLRQFVRRPPPKGGRDAEIIRGAITRARRLIKDFGHLAR